jgi:hypothetical protein
MLKISRFTRSACASRNRSVTLRLNGFGWAGSSRTPGLGTGSGSTPTFDAPTANSVALLMAYTWPSGPATVGVYRLANPGVSTIVSANEFVARSQR